MDSKRHRSAVATAQRGIDLYQHYLLAAIQHSGRPRPETDYLELPAGLAPISSAAHHALTLATLAEFRLGLDENDEAQRWRTFLRHTAQGTLSRLRPDDMFEVDPDFDEAFDGMIDDFADALDDGNP
jgi:hypothetical protein